MAEVDELGDVGVSLEVVLADFEDQPGFQLELALAAGVCPTRNSSWVRSSTEVRLQVSNALSAACMAGSTSAGPAW